ncbi:hypothetical protein QF034_002474 [Streptomyces africanus]|uniref:Uncharacterized protein n=1 Tax=Streptomyces africanus TaxID=231024 RepID=A0ABU0QLJ4_9ACTN|nr:hypothetical protein [Streptomyces africanus]
MDQTPAGDHTVGVGLPLLQPESAGPVPAQPLDLRERALVEEEFQALAGRQLAFGVLGIGGRLARTAPDGGAQFGEFVRTGPQVRGTGWRCDPLHDVAHVLPFLKESTGALTAAQAAAIT